MQKPSFILLFTFFINFYAPSIRAQTHPNIIYILADDLGYGDVSVYNPNGKIKTPHIDQLAANGMRFTDAHSGSAVCTPTRYGILTGRYSWRGKLKQGVLDGYSPALLEANRLTVARFLKQNGYQTACIGKWHLGLDWQLEDTTNYPVNFSQPVAKSPNDYGFDYSYILPASLDMSPYVYLENGQTTMLPDHETVSKSKYGWWRAGPTAPDFTHETVLQHFADKAIAYINQPKSKPFFMYLPLAAPHTPILPTEKWRGKSGLGEYGDFVLMVDDVLGQIQQTLKDNNLTENTLIIFTSDNGCSPSAGTDVMEAAGHFSSGPFRGYKADIYEGGHRIPFVIQWANKIPVNSVSEETICLTDLLRTAAGIIGTSLPETAGEDSYDISKIWRKEAAFPLREATVHHSINGTFAIRKGDWKLILAPDSGGWSEPKPDAKQPDGVQLYNLKNDIRERQNVVEQHPAIVAELKQLLKTYIENGRSTPGPRQPYYHAEGWNITQKL